MLTQRLDAGMVERVEGEAGYGRLLRTLRETDRAGHDLDVVLTEALSGRRLDDAESVSDVLRSRVRYHAEHRTPERRVDPGDWTTLLTGQDGPVGEYVHALAERASLRQAQLGRDDADRAAAWAVGALGAVPALATVERPEWERRAGIAAAYRELRGIDDAQTSLGGAPSREQELPRACRGRAATLASGRYLLLLGANPSDLEARGSPLTRPHGRGRRRRAATNVLDVQTAARFNRLEDEMRAGVTEIGPRDTRAKHPSVIMLTMGYDRCLSTTTFEGTP